MLEKQHQGAGPVNKASAIFRSAGVIGLSTLASRVLGLVRDVVMYGLFGTGMVAEAFYVAFMIPALLRRLVGEGSLTVSFIPVFTKYREDRGEEEARLFLRTFWTLMTVVLSAMTVLGIALSRPIVGLFTNPDFEARYGGEQFELAVTLTRFMFPYLFLIGLVALAMGILNSHKRFFSAAFHPVLLNVGWILSIVVLERLGYMGALAGLLGWKWLETPGMPIVLGVLFGGVLQLLLQVPFLIETGMSFKPRFNFGHPAVRRIGALMLPSLFTVGVVQINTLISTYFLTAFEGARSQIFLANRLTEFPYALVSLAVATASLPTLSEQAGRGDHAALARTLNRGLRMVLAVMLPAAVGLALLGRPLVHIVFEHGEFTSSDTAMVSNMLIMFCLGLWAVAGLRVVVQAFYAVEDMRTPFYAAAFGMILSALGCWLLSGIIEAPGVPLAISAAAIGNLGILWLRLPKRVDNYRAEGVGKTVVLSLLACAPMAAWVWAGNALGPWGHDGAYVLKGLTLAAQVIGGGAIYVLSARILGLPEAIEILKTVANRLARKP